MEITFKLTLQDLMALDLYLYQRRLFSFPNSLFSAAVLFTTFFLTGFGLWSRAQGSAIKPYVFGPFYCLTSSAVVCVLLFCIQRLGTAKNAPELLASRTFRIESDAIAIRMGEQTSFLLWPAVLRIDKQGRHIFLMLGTNYAVVIPPSVFTTTERADAFLAETRNVWNQAKSAAAAPVCKTQAADAGDFEVEFSLLPEDIAALDRLIARRNSVSP